MRKKIIAGNWKMNKDLEEGIQLAKEIITRLEYDPLSNTEIILIPPFPYLNDIFKLLPEFVNVKLGAQNCHTYDSGAFTGEVSAQMLYSVGATYVLIGHSERRTFFGESNSLLAQKINAALKHKLTPIFCCGEEKKTRDSGNHTTFVQGQIEESLFHLSEQQIANVVIAYEPIWAIGTNVTPTPNEVVEMHKHIRKIISDKYGASTAQNISILYGGSCNATNAIELFSQPDIDGGLIGGASLQAESFLGVINALKL